MKLTVTGDRADGVTDLTGLWSPVAVSRSYSTPLNSCCTVAEASA
jgi:hypothetical protein